MELFSVPELEIHVVPRTNVIPVGTRTCFGELKRYEVRENRAVCVFEIESEVKKIRTIIDVTAFDGCDAQGLSE